MKILLIYPPDWGMTFVDGPSFLRHSDSTNRMPPLGILYIASHLMANTDHEVDVLDAHVEGLSYNSIEDRIRSFKPDIVGITAYTLTFLDTLEIAKRAKRVNPEIFVVVGGSHASIYPGETAMLPDIDAAVSGEGEYVMTELVNALDKGLPLDDIPGLYFERNRELISTPARAVITDLDSLNFPARQLLPAHAYRHVTDHGTYATTMISCRGCTSSCAFCNVPYRSIRARSPENVVREIAECYEMGYGEIKFYDDTFNFTEEHAMNIARGIIDSGLDIKFSTTARVDNVSPKLMKTLYDAGCRRIGYGIEAAEDRFLKVLRKDTTIDMVRRAVKLTKDAGIEVLAFFLIGIPGQTADDIKREIDFAIELDPDFVIITYVVLFPATELYTRALKDGAFESDFFLEFAKNPAPSPIMAYWPNPLSFEETQKLTRMAYKRFLLRPAYIWKQFRKLQSFTDFYRKSKTATSAIAYTLSSKYNRIGT